MFSLACVSLSVSARDGAKTYLYAFLDDASRLVPFAAFCLADYHLTSADAR